MKKGNLPAIDKETNDILIDLNPKERRFVYNVASGMTYANAYTDAGYKGDPLKTASRKTQDPRIQKAINALLEEQRKASFITKDRVLLNLFKIATDEEEATRDKLKAFDMINKMQGHYDEQSNNQPITVVIPGNIAINPTINNH